MRVDGAVVQKRFKFYWLTGKTEESTGTSVADALMNLGYGGGATAALDYYVELPNLPE